MTTWLHEQRLLAALTALKEAAAETVLDLGCGDGPLLTRLAQDPAIKRIVGIDLSTKALDRLDGRLRLAPMEVRRKVELVHGSITECKDEFSGFDAAVLLEMIEHIEPDHLSNVERAVFGELRPKAVIITTPNSDFNRLLGVPGYRFRHRDHRFEWGRAKFRAWGDGVAKRREHAVRYDDIAGAHPECGGATQMAVFKRLAAAGCRRWHCRK